MLASAVTGLAGRRLPSVPRIPSCGRSPFVARNAHVSFDRWDRLLPLTASSKPDTIRICVQLLLLLPRPSWYLRDTSCLHRSLFSSPRSLLPHPNLMPLTRQKHTRLHPEARGGDILARSDPWPSRKAHVTCDRAAQAEPRDSEGENDQAKRTPRGSLPKRKNRRREPDPSAPEQAPQKPPYHATTNAPSSAPQTTSSTRPTPGT